MKKTVYVHDRIVFLGGAEEVLRMLVRKYSNKDTTIYCLFSPRKTFEIDGQQIPLVTALPRRMNQLIWRGTTTRIVKSVLDYRNLMPLYPWLCALLRKKIQRTAPERVVISSFAAVKNIVSAFSHFHILTILYLHSPMQYIRENYDEYVQKIQGPKALIFRRVTTYLRKRDKKFREYDEVFANSEYTAACAKKYYDLEPKLRYPELPEAYLTASIVDQPRDYFVYVGRLVRFIREVDRIIALCNKLDLPLLVLGSGPDEEYLKSIAGPTVVFLGQINDVHEKVEVLKYARGLINLAKESCGIATMEALALGVPVFGYDAGGSVELVDEDSGLLVGSKDMETLSEQMNIFMTKKRDRELIQKNFRRKMRYEG